MKARNEDSMQGDEVDQHERTTPLTETEAAGDATKPVSRRRRLFVRALKSVVVLVAAWLLLGLSDTPVALAALRAPSRP